MSHRSAKVTVVERRGKKWTERDYRAGETIRLDEHHAAFSIDEIYEGIKLDAARPAPKRTRAS